MECAHREVLISMDRVCKQHVCLRKMKTKTSQKDTDEISGTTYVKKPGKFDTQKTY